MSCPRTKHSASDESRTSDPLISSLTLSWVKVQNFLNPELWKFILLNLQDAYKINNFMFKWLNVLR